MGKARQPVSIDGVEFDALIDSEEGYEAQVPEYPTEKGVSGCVYIKKNPDQIKI